MVEDLALRRTLFNALGAGEWQAGVLRRTIECLERDPLAAAGAFPGDLLRRLMELPPRVWVGEPALYLRYRAVLRAAALARRNAPDAVRRGFWRDLPARLPSSWSGG